MRVICAAFRDFVRGNRYLNSDLLFVVFEICFRRDANKPNIEFEMEDANWVMIHCPSLWKFEYNKKSSLDGGGAHIEHGANDKYTFSPERSDIINEGPQ